MLNYTAADLTTQSQRVNRSQAHMLLFQTSGLKPNTKHNAFIDGVSYNFACKPFGKDLGENLVSDSNGKLMFYVLYEIDFMRPKDFEYTNKQSLSNELSETSKNVNFVNIYKILEIKSEDDSSYSQFQITVPMMLVNGADSGPNIHP